MRSYVVKRFPQFRHSRRRRIDSPSLLSRESTTLSFSNPQKGHFIVRRVFPLRKPEPMIVTGGESGCGRNPKPTAEAQADAEVRRKTKNKRTFFYYLSRFLIRVHSRKFAADLLLFLRGSAPSAPLWWVLVFVAPAYASRFSSSSMLSSSTLISETCSRWASNSPAGITDMKVTSHSMMPQLVATSGAM